MRVIEVRPSTGGGATVARFDVQLEGMRLFNLALKHGPSGYRVFAPSAFGDAVATFTPETAEALISAAIGEIASNESKRAA